MKKAGKLVQAAGKTEVGETFKDLGKTVVKNSVEVGLEKAVAGINKVAGVPIAKKAENNVPEEVEEKAETENVPSDAHDSKKNLMTDEEYEKDFNSFGFGLDDADTKTKIRSEKKEANRGKKKAKKNKTKSSKVVVENKNNKEDEVSSKEEVIVEAKVVEKPEEKKEVIVVEEVKVEEPKKETPVIVPVVQSSVASSGGGRGRKSAKRGRATRKARKASRRR